MAEINASRFSGMNNVNDSFMADEGVVSPKVLLNANVGPAGDIESRSGYTLFLSLSGAHSLWACETHMFCVANGVLYNISGKTAVVITTVSGPKDEVNGHVDYTLCEDKVYMSNLYWNGVYDLAANAFSSWGITLPPGPMVLTASGSLPAGTYHVCYTAVSGSDISGNGPITSITLAATGGIQLLNRPAGALVWATDVNEHVFYMVGAVGSVTQIPTVEPLPSFLCSPPPYMQNLTYAFGRIWGSSGAVLYYSEPYRFGWFKTTINRFQFDSDITMIAKVPTGLFIGMADQTVFLAGTEPEQMTQSGAGAGSASGTLDYANNVPYLADVLGTPEKVFVDVPIWRTADGIVAGNTTGRLFNLTKDKLKMGSTTRGASLYHSLNGVFQFLTSSLRASGNSDADTAAAFEDGSIPTNDISKRIMTSMAGISDSVSCEVWRGGVLVPP